MAKSKKAGRPPIWPEGSQKPLNLGPFPVVLHADIKAYAKRAKQQFLDNIHLTARQVIKKEEAKWTN